MLAIASNQIDLWLLDTDAPAVHDAALLLQYRSLLNAEELARVQRFHFAKDQHRALLTRALVRTVLSRYAAVEPAQWAFSHNEYGKPHIVHAEPVVQELSFNVSHTRGLIALGVTRARALGVDVEEMCARNAAHDVARAYFAPAEARALAQLDPALQQERFFRLWTLKESYIKARGLGLTLPLEQFSFDLSQAGQIGFSTDPALQDDAARWHYGHYQPTPAHWLAVCIERGAIGDVPLRYALRRVIPLCEEEPLIAVAQAQTPVALR